jgi:hypothetical protein
VAIKLSIENLEDVPEPLRAEYVKDGDVYRLQVDDAVPKQRLDEFRETNKAQRKKIEELEKRFNGIDPDEFKSLKQKYEGIEPEELERLRQELSEFKKTDGKEKEKTKAELEKQIKELHDKHVADLAKHTAAWEKEKADKDALLSARDRALSSALIENQIATLSNQNSVRPEALKDISARGKEVFHLENGVVVPYKPDGEKWFSDATGELLKMPEWFKLLIAEAPHLFKENSGTGASGGGNAVGGGGQQRSTSEENPWKTGNRTEQAKIMAQTDGIAKARALAAAAGMKRIPF